MKRFIVVLSLIASPALAQIGPVPAGGAGSIGSGTSLTSCTSSILYADASSLLKCDPAAVVNGSVSTAGRSILTIRDTISGSSATSNFLNITGTFPATLSAETSGALVSITGDNDAQIQSGLKAIVTGSTTSNIYAVYGVANAASTNAGGVRGDSTAAASRGVGVWGTSSSTGAIGGFFGIGSAAPQSASYALGADNGNAAQDIFRAMDNGTAVVKIVDGGQFQGLAGSATAPGISFTAETGTGLYQATNRMNVAIAQGDHWSFNAGGATAELQLGNNTQFSWNSSYPPTAADGDTGLKRVAAGVVGPTSGSTLTAAGWLQQTAGELALNADYTNATTTFSNTALSATLISGRTYNFSVNLLLSDSVAADGFKLDFNGGAATITNFRVNCMATNDTTGATVAFTAATAAALATVLNVATLASTGTHMVICNGTVVPSSSSTFILRAAQNAHTTGTLTITRGSWISIRDASPL